MNAREAKIVKDIERIRNRKAIQNLFFIIFLFIIILSLKGDVNNAHQFCPYASICFGTMLPSKIVSFPIAIGVGILILIVTAFIGRKFCSYFCFLGSLQEKIYSIHKRKNKFKHLFPFKLHNILNKIKYLILLGTIVAAASFHQYLYMKYCPVINFSFFTRIGLPAIGFVVIFIFLSFIIERFWCRYLCPYGALMNIFQILGKILKIRKFYVTRNVESSLGCRNCQNYCPMQIDLGKTDIIKDIECIHCLRCVRICTKTKSEISKCIYRDNI